MNEFGLSENAKTIFKNLYSHQTETIEDTFKRVAKEFSVTDEDEGLAYNLLASNTWRPNTPVFLNAGTDHKNFCACFPEGHINTKKGLKDIKDVSKGDYILTHNGSFEKVSEKMSRRYKGKIYNINATGFIKNYLKPTEEHPFYIIEKENFRCRRQKNCVCTPVSKMNNTRCFRKERQYRKDCSYVPFYEKKWKTAKELKVGDYLLISFDKTIKEKNTLDISNYIEKKEKYKYKITDNEIYYQSTNKINRFISIDNKLLRLFGYYLAEGSISDVGDIRFTFNLYKKEEKVYCEEIKSILEDIFGLSPYIDDSSISGTIFVRVHSIILAQLLTSLFGKSHKKISRWILILPPYLQRELLIGMFRGDGYISKNNLRLIQANFILTHQLWEMLMRCGMYFNFSKFSHSEKSGYQEEPFMLETSVNYIEDFVKEIWNDIDIPIKDFLQKRTFEVDGHFAIPIKDITCEIFDGIVYNMEVENDNSYTVLNIAIHNCHVIGLQDSMESIYDVANVSRKIFQYGAGVGIPIGNLREKEAFIFEGNPNLPPEGKSSGPIVFMRLYDAVGDTTKSGGRVRRAAIMVSMYVWHPDIMEFIQCKQNEGWLTNMNISVAITDKFMQCLEDKVPFQLYTPFDGTEKGTIDPQELWDTLSVMAHKTGDPGVLFLDTVQRFNPLKKKFLIESTNPCVTGDTLILTDKGYFPIRELVGKKVNVWNGHEWSEVEPKVTGKNQSIVRVSFSDGSFIDCTPYHNFYIEEGKDHRRPKVRKYEAKDILPNMKLERFSFPIIEGKQDLPEKEAYTKGVFCGDGSTESNRDRQSIWLYGGKRNLLDHLDYERVNECEGERLFVKLHQRDWSKTFVPDTRYTIKTRLNWLAGVLDTDAGFTNGGGYAIWSINREFLMNVKYMLHTLGINSTLSLGKQAGIKKMPDGKGGKKDYQTQDSWRLSISGSSIFKLVKLGLKTHRINTNFVPKHSRNRLIKIVNVEKIGKEDEVYCFIEPKRHKGTFGCVSIGNCGEQPLMPFGVCNLSAINIGKFVKDEEFDWDGLYKTAYDITGLMDNIIDTMDYPDPRFKDTAQRYRQIGVGLMGLADAMYKLNYRYDGPEGKKFAAEVMRTITTACVEKSADMAAEKGTFFEYEEYKEDLLDILQQQINDRKVLKRVQKYGVRNSQFTTCQPTGCLVGNTLVSSSKGLLEIKKYKNVDMKRVKTKSDFSISHIKNWYDQGIAETIKIKTKKGYKLQGTYDHKVRVISRGNGYIWKRLDELAEDDLIVLKKNFIIDKKTYFSSNKAEFLGFYMADGWWTVSGRGHRLYFKINKNEKDYIINLIHNAFPIANPICREYGNSYRIEINSKKIYKWFEKYECIKNGAENAFIPDIILQGSRELMFSFVRGYLKGDGHITEKNNEAGFTTVSKTLANQIHILLLGLGFPSRLRKEDIKGNTVVIENREVNCNFNPYKITLTSFYRKHLCDILGIPSVNENRNYERIIIMPYEEHLFPERKKEQKITTVTYNRYNEVIKNKNWFVENELLLDRIEKIEKCNIENVYDLEVYENTHTYVANGFVTHNTTALSCDCSYGIEPIFGLVFEKKLTDGGTMRIANPFFIDRVKDEEWWNDGVIDRIFENGGSLKGIHGIPREVREVFITAHDIKPKDRIDMQASIQKHCSTAISSTVNLQKETTAQEIADLYKYAWSKGLKGLTIYRDGSKKQQPVIFRKEKEAIIDISKAIMDLKIERPRRLSGETYTVETGNGKMYVTINSTQRKPVEVFIEVGKAGQSMKVMSEALGRIVSIALQHRVPVLEVIKTLKGLDSSSPAWYRFEEDDSRPIQILSIPDGLAQLLERYYINTSKDNTEFLNGSSLSTCKKCGSKAYLETEGCGVCQNCGFSHCS